MITEWGPKMLPCGCGQVKHEINILACEKCLGPCCGDCFTDCPVCQKMICINCTGVVNKNLCYSCDFKQQINREQYIERARGEIAPADSVVIVVAGTAYRVNNDNGNAGILVAGTNLSGDLEHLKIKGIGTIEYIGQRTVRSKFNSLGVSEGLEYRLFFRKER